MDRKEPMNTLKNMNFHNCTAPNTNHRKQWHKGPNIRKTFYLERIPVCAHKKGPCFYATIL